MIVIRVTTELVEWVQERLDTDADEAQNFAEEFAGALYFTGGLAEIERLAAATPDLLKACEAAVRFLNLISTKEHNPELIASICLIREMTLEPAITKAKQ